MEIPAMKVVFGEDDRREILARIEDSLATGMLAQGQYVRQFEGKWSEYLGVKYAVATCSGGAALEVCLQALNVKDKEVLIPVNTFAATPLSVLLAGGKVRFTDIDAATLSPSLEQLKRRVTPKTAGVIIVHIGGIVTPEIEDIRSWCSQNGLWLLEDAAHAHGSEINGRKAGTFGLAGTFSFFATKIMTTAEGGIIVTQSEELTKRATILRDYGKAEPWVSYHTDSGFNWRMSELHAAIGLTQLKRLDAFITWRENIAKLYTQLLQQIPEATPVLPKDRSSWYKYIVLLNQQIDKGRVKKSMKQQGISLSGGVYDVPLHQQPIFKTMADGEFPIADDFCRRHICLPIYYGMTGGEAEFVVESLKRGIKEAR
ncbi:MAG: DegT/DnrJ/EryC1/StrS family aminotransferase [Chloroflexi bacterium]|nr:MAG: DegT/DnrJ/EryC1/StrS family aminotransferase [Chloroflexota bacterium]